MSTGNDGLAKAALAATTSEGQPLPEGVPAAATAPDLPAPANEPPRPSLRRDAMSGAMWIGVGFGTMYMLRLVSSVILTRLVLPETYALMDVAMVFIQGLHMFSDVGIGTSIVQSKHGDDPDFLNTAWTLQILRGLVLWTATALIAWPVAAFYGKPVLMFLMPAVGVTALLDGLNATSVHTLHRRLVRGPLVAMEVGTAIAGTCVTIAWVWLVVPHVWGSVPSHRVTVSAVGTIGQLPLNGWGYVAGGLVTAADVAQRDLLSTLNVWGFVAGSLVTSLVFLGLSHVVLPGPRNRLHWNRVAVRELLTFGKWIFVSTIITFLAFQADRLIVPKLSGFAVMGIYGRALSLTVIATGLMSTFATQLVFPLYSRLQHEGKDIRSKFIEVHTRAAAFAALLVAGMLSAGPAAVGTLYGDAYKEAGWMLRLLAVGAWFQMLEGTTGASLLTLGQPRAVTFSNASRLIGVLVFVPLGWWLGGLVGPDGDMGGPFIGMVGGFIAADFVRYLVVVWMAHLNGMSAVKYDFAMALLILAVSPAAAYAGQYLGGLVGGQFANPKMGTFSVFVCQGSLVVALWGLLYMVWFRTSLGRKAMAA
jgi:O-antigen/teichoic acid export membrane protein